MIVDHWGRVLARLPRGSRRRARRARPRSGRAATRAELSRAETPGARHDDANALQHARATRIARAVRPRRAGRLEQALESRARRRRVDAGDLYFQLVARGALGARGRHRQGRQPQHRAGRRRARAWRASSTGFAYSDEVVLPALLEAARAARAIARDGRRAARSRPGTPTGGRTAVPADRPDRSRSPTTTRSRCSRQLDREARALDPRVKQVMASLAAVARDRSWSPRATARSPPTCGRWCA